MLKIFDCSNSEERPMNRNFGGPIQNEFVSLLHKHCNNYFAKFVDDVNECDIIFTNDIYPEYILEIDKPKVKRMDGIFWQSDLKERNEKYNKAAEQSDLVIFISEYSRNSYYKLYGNHLKKDIVVTHWVEKYSDYFNEKSFNGIFFSMATDWSRKEKRLSEVIKFAEMFPEDLIMLIGKCEELVPKNVIRMGYLETNSEYFKRIITVPTAFLNLTCKDAATKTVCLSINYGIPVLYANSGGVGELVGNCGQSIKELDNIEFLDYIPNLDEQDIRNGYEKFIDNYDTFEHNILEKLSQKPLEESLSQYFNNIRNLK